MKKMMLFVTRTALIGVIVCNTNPGIVNNVIVGAACIALYALGTYEGLKA